MSSFLSYTLFLFLVLLNLPIAFYHQIKNNADSFSHPAEFDSADPVCLRCRIFLWTLFCKMIRSVYSVSSTALISFHAHKQKN